MDRAECTPNKGKSPARRKSGAGLFTSVILSEFKAVHSRELGEARAYPLGGAALTAHWPGPQRPDISFSICHRGFGGAVTDVTPRSGQRAVTVRPTRSAQEHRHLDRLVMAHHYLGFRVFSAMACGMWPRPARRGSHHLSRHHSSTRSSPLSRCSHPQLPCCAHNRATCIATRACAASPHTASLVLNRKFRFVRTPRPLPTRGGRFRVAPPGH